MFELVPRRGYDGDDGNGDVKNEAVFNCCVGPHRRLQNREARAISTGGLVGAIMPQPVGINPTGIQRDIKTTSKRSYDCLRSKMAYFFSNRGGQNRAPYDWKSCSVEAAPAQIEAPKATLPL